MDEVYMRMCDCPEIQEQWEPKDGDRFSLDGAYYTLCEQDNWVYLSKEEAPENYITWNPDYLESYHNTFHQFDGGYEWETTKIGNREDAIWLPRQENIQGMLSKGTCWFEKHFRFYEWAGRTSPTGGLSAWNRFGSIDQLWMAFYMDSAHEKTWTGKGWQ